MVFDGIRFLKDFRIPFSETGSNISQGWVGLKCPFCGDHSDHMGMNISVGAFSCWRCGSKGTIDTISRLLSIPKADASKIYAQYLVRFLGRVESGGARKKANASQVILPGKEFTKKEKRYMQERMILSKAEQYDLRSGGIIGDWQFRIVIPITLNGVIVSATGRYIYNDEEIIRYKTLSREREVVCHKHLFLGLDLVPSDEVIAVVEGPIDAIRGGPGFVSSFGITMMPEQLALLSRYKKVIFMFDNEAQAQRQAEKYGIMLTSISDVEVERIQLDGPYKDLGEMPDDEIADVRREIGLCL